MSKSDRDELRKVVREEAKLGHKMAEQRAAELLADAEAQLAMIFKADDETWRDLTAAAQAVVRKADALLAERCRELGIPENFRPQLGLSWHGRGENADKERRSEMRRVFQRRIEALQKAAITKIETVKVQGLTMLARDGLETEEATAFLDAMPKAEVLMPRLDVPELLKLPELERRKLAQHGSDRLQERLSALLPESLAATDDGA